MPLLRRISLRVNLLNRRGIVQEERRGLLGGLFCVNIGFAKSANCQ